MDAGRYHLVGVAGVGMNPLAQALLAAGCEVSGSDRYLDTGQDLEVLPKLQRAGVRLVPQDGSGITSETRAVVVSTAIEAGNPDLAAAARHGVPVRHRAEMLAQLAEGRECIAITGTCGKTTVTGMVGFLLEQLGDDPTVVNGGIVVNWESAERIGNVRVGRSARWVIEADESDRSLLRFCPDWAIITNLSADHFSMDETAALFATFSAQVKHALVGPWEKDREPWRGFQPELSAGGSRFAYGGQRFHLPLLGHHNAENALEAVMLCERLGHRLGRIADALRGFRGIRRRLDVAGTANGVTVIDDYAHNPAKIRATWEAVAPYHKRVLAVWRPHGFGPLSNMFDDLKAVFREMASVAPGTLKQELERGTPANERESRVPRPSSDLGVRQGTPPAGNGIAQRGARLYILPVYYAGGTAKGAATSDLLVGDLATEGIPIELVPDYDTLVGRIAAEARPDDAVLVMGARDPNLPALARRILDAVGASRPG
jgi:UDP-N-acetylmuramate--alanine ligase